MKDNVEKRDIINYFDVCGHFLFGADDISGGELASG